ncbi:FAD-binding protein [Ruminococcus bromii]|uniref:FAD-binding protein n=1 Tax=Ruminococcus bromii TaxID=40518 RepID=UPI003FD8F384
MMLLNKEKCIGCGACIDACPFHAIAMEDKFPNFLDNCVLCGACERKCPCGAISKEETVPESEMVDLTSYKGVWVVAEIEESTNSFKKVSFELTSEARKLADKLGQELAVVCVCEEEPKGMQESFKELGCDKIYVVQNAGLGSYDTEKYAEVVTELIRKYQPEIVLYAATEDGRDLAPRVSARLQVGLTADCTSLDIDDKKQLLQIRPTYGGSIIASIVTPNHRPQMASVRPNVFAVNRRPSDCVEVVYETIPLPSKTRVEHIEDRQKAVVYKNVSEATVIVGVGYGIGSLENVELVHKLCKKMGAAVGGTRKVVDEGWLPFDVQIGQTGKTIAPDLYIACGISGALQHTIGVRNAKKIIAINNDPAAPIFKMCDVAMLGDVGQVLRALLQMTDAEREELFGSEK